jgi:hypothetical protein
MNRPGTSFAVELAGMSVQTLLQLNPPIPLRTPRGEGLAVLVIDYGPDHDLWWTVILTKGAHAGEIWTYANPDVRGVENVTLGRPAAPVPKDDSNNRPEPVVGIHPGEKEQAEHGGDRGRPPMRGTN